MNLSPLPALNIHLMNREQIKIKITQYYSNILFLNYLLLQSYARLVEIKPNGK